MSKDVSKYKKTKIIATIGPVVEDKIEQLLGFGVDGVRLNFSHNTHVWHKSIIDKVRDAARKLDRSIAVIQDLQGPKLRLGILPPGGITISAGQTVKFKYGPKGESGDEILPIQYDFSEDIKRGDIIYLRDGQVKCVTTSVKDGVIGARAINSGKISSNHGINLPDTPTRGSIITSKDKRDIDFALKNDIDYIALSFIHSAKDIETLRHIVAKSKRPIRIIAKIETKIATQNLREIIQAADAVMIARGDLAIETAPEQVPLIGREIILLARQYKRPVIMATQMLESMMTSTQPSRAEANDVATAVRLGVDAVMLSGETATGQYPIETVQMMKRIIVSSELYFAASARDKIDFLPEEGKAIDVSSFVLTELINAITQTDNSRSLQSTGSVQTSVGLAAITLARQVGAKLILAETLTGSTALAIASLRPPMPILITSPGETVCNQMSIVWGGKPFLVSYKQRDSVNVMSRLKKIGNVAGGDLIVHAFGKNHSVAGGTDTIRLIQVP